MYSIAMRTICSLLSAPLLGCVFSMGDLSLVASENVGLEPQIARRSVEGQDCVYTVLLFIPINGLVPNIEEAMDRAMEKVPEGNVMTNVALYSDVVMIPYIFTSTCLRAKGDVGVLE
jgi:hypothetical protein